MLFRLIKITIEIDEKTQKSPIRMTFNFVYEFIGCQFYNILYNWVENKFTRLI